MRIKDSITKVSLSVVYAFFVFTLLCNENVLAARVGLTKKTVQSYVKNLDEKKIKVKLSIDHPDYPARIVLQAIKADQNSNSRKVIKILEPILTQIKYKSIVSKIGKDRVKLTIGTIGAFDLWRELLYVILGRAYYNTQQNYDALYYFSGVPLVSPFGVSASLQKGWTLLRLKEYSKAKKNVSRLSSYIGSAGPNLSREIKLQQAYIEAVVGDVEEALEIAEPLKFNKAIEGNLIGIRSQILAQSLFRVYFKKSNSLGFNSKRKILNRIVNYLNEIPPIYRNDNLSFLAAETYWHLSNTFRIENPKKYRRQSRAALSQAENWLAPWVNRSMKQGLAILPEDAMFLSVAILWEQEKI